MCGILGGNVSAWNYEKGLGAIKHRGPDGQKIERYNEFTLGFCRLAIRDLSKAAMQPMSNEKKDVHIVYNGEIYGYEKLKKELEKKYCFLTTSDTEVVLNAYLEYGESFIDKIDGIFSIAIYDERIQKIYLYRDRVGVKPLYYLCKGNKFGFASELKGLENTVNDFRLEIDFTAVYDFLFYQYIPAPKSLYTSVYKLPPATMLVYDVSEKKILKKERYWNISVNSSIKRKKKKEEVSEELRYLLQQSVKKQLAADVPVGTFLSGGIDSSIITYEASRFQPQIKAFSIGFYEKEYDESEIAERFCRGENILIQKKVLGISDISKIRNRIQKWYDEPYADTSAYPTYLVSEFARNDVTVVLTGDGGDELFGGYGRHSEFVNACRTAKTFQTPSECLDYEKKILRSIMAMPGFDDYRNYAERWNIPKDYNPYEYLERLDIPELPPLTRIRYLDFNTYLHGDILTKVDRASMAVSLEARVPFLCREVIEFAFSLSQEECNEGDGLKMCLKQAYDKVIPDEILYGKKKGFGIPSDYLWRERKAESISAGILEEHWKEIIAEGSIAVSPGQTDQKGEYYKKYKREEAYYKLLSQWMTLNENGITLEKILQRRGFNKIAIYGMADVGRHLYRALKGTEIKVLYGIDQNKRGCYEDIIIKKPGECMEEVDAVIVTAIIGFNNIKSRFGKKINYPFISLEEILFETEMN